MTERLVCICEEESEDELYVDHKANGACEVHLRIKGSENDDYNYVTLSKTDKKRLAEFLLEEDVS